MAQSLRSPPVSMFGAVMGLAGLGLACRGAAPVVPQPPAFSEIWVGLGALALALLLAALGFRIVVDFKAVKDEFNDPARLGFCATLPLALTLVAGGVQPYSPDLGGLLWWSGAVLLLALQVWALGRWLRGGIELAQVNAGWMLVLIGGIVVPVSGLPLGHAEASRFLFGISAAASPIVIALVFYRAVAAPPLPEAMRPTWFIFLVPPSLLYANGAALAGGQAGPALEALFFSALLLAPALFLAAARFARWPFGAPWWAFTFPLDALAGAAAHYARAHPGAPWDAIAAATLALAVLFVALVLYRTVAALVRGTLFAP